MYIIVHYVVRRRKVGFARIGWDEEGESEGVIYSRSSELSARKLNAFSFPLIAKDRSGAGH